MGFFDEFVDLGGGGTFLKSEEKQQVIENGIIFTIDKLAMDEENQYGPRFVAFCPTPHWEADLLVLDLPSLDVGD